MTKGLGKSDRPVAPEKSPNKAGQPAAEGMGRGLAKGNLPQQNEMSFCHTRSSASQRSVGAVWAGFWIVPLITALHPNVKDMQRLSAFRRLINFRWVATRYTRAAADVTQQQGAVLRVSVRESRVVPRSRTPDS